MGIYKDMSIDSSHHFATMAPKVNTNQDFLQKVYKGSAKVRKQAVASASSGQIKALCECALNACSGRVKKVKPQHLKKLRAKEGHLIRLAYARDPIETKKKLLLQTGGALPLLASLGLSALGSFIPSLFGK